MRRMKKFAEGGSANRAADKRERRMADIEKDYKIALAKGKSEKEANAKRNQRTADAADDFAKRTGADRTETRAAEKAAEARLKAARRSPDKGMNAISVLGSEGAKPLSRSLVDTSAKIAMPKVAMPKADKPKAGTPKAGTPTKEAPKPSRHKMPLSTSAQTDAFIRKLAPPPTPASSGKPLAERPYGFGGFSGGKNKRDADERNQPSATPAAKTPPKEAPKTPRPTPAQLAARLKQLTDISNSPRTPSNNKAKGGAVKKMAKGGKIDGCAIRGKTRATRNK